MARKEKGKVEGEKNLNPVGPVEEEGENFPSSSEMICSLGVPRG